MEENQQKRHHADNCVTNHPSVEFDPTIPLQRKWINLPAPNEQPHKPSEDESFTVITYNILADFYVQENEHPHCPRQYFREFQRFPQLMRELDHHSADIVCLQEVGREYYKTHLEPMLRNQGYQGSLSESRDCPEGVATFFRKSCFQLVEEEPMNFSRLLEEELADNKSIDASAVSSLCSSRRPFLYTRLRSKKTGKILTLGNTHLTFNQNLSSLALSALETALSIRHLIKLAGGTDRPHIMCGDFNQEPHMPGYQLLQDGCLSEKNKEYLRKILMKNSDQKGVCLVDLLPNSFAHESKHLKSAYKTVVGYEVPFSNHEDCFGVKVFPSRTSADKQTGGQSLSPKTAKVEKDDFDESPRKEYRTEIEKYGKEVYIAALDYFWYGSDLLRCIGVLEMIDESKIEQFHSCPNIAFPSDHLLMKAEFRFL